MFNNNYTSYRRIMMFLIIARRRRKILGTFLRQKHDFLKDFVIFDVTKSQNFPLRGHHFQAKKKLTKIVV